MSDKRRAHLLAFIQHGVNSHATGMWRNPKDKVNWDWTRPPYETKASFASTWHGRPGSREEDLAGEIRSIIQPYADAEGLVREVLEGHALIARRTRDLPEAAALPLRQHGKALTSAAL